MHYPVMTERQLAARWKNSLKTLRRWRSDNEGPTWHKLFQYVRYHEADVLDFERQSAQHWSAILGDDERVPKVVTRPPQDQPQTQEDAGAFCVTTQDVIEATGLPKHWFTTPEYRTRKQVPHLTWLATCASLCKPSGNGSKTTAPSVGRRSPRRHHLLRTQNLRSLRACRDGMNLPGNWIVHWPLRAWIR